MSAAIPACLHVAALRRRRKGFAPVFQGKPKLSTLMPLDTFVPAPVSRMKVVGDPERLMPTHERMQAVLDRAEGRAVQMDALERFDFYAAARQAFAVVGTSDPGPYGCLILRKGVI